jgi:hypothetical protein
MDGDIAPLLLFAFGFPSVKKETRKNLSVATKHEINTDKIHNFT